MHHVIAICYSQYACDEVDIFPSFVHKYYLILIYFTGHKHLLDNMLNLKVKSSCKVNIDHPQDEESPRISSCAFLPNGELLLVDHRNFNLKLLDRELVLQNSFLLPNKPLDVSVVDSSTVVITFSKDKRLQFIQIYPSFSKGSSVKFDKKCHGVAVSAEHIYVTCHNNDKVKKAEEDWTPGEVCILDRRGNEIRRINGSNEDRLRFITPYYVAVNRDGSTIYVSDMATGTITALTTTGDILFQYTSPDSDGLWSIKQMYIDSQSNILVCGLDTHNVQIITGAGQKYKTMLISSDGLRKPEGIAYRSSDGTLVVGCIRQNALCVFKLVHTQEMIPATPREHLSGKEDSRFNKDVKIK